MAFARSAYKGHFRIRQKRRILLFFGVLIAFLCFADLVPGDSEMSDAKKKEAVYRMYAGYKKDFPKVRDISPQQAMELLNQGMVVFVDIRTPAEMAVSMLPGAIAETKRS